MANVSGVYFITLREAEGADPRVVPGLTLRIS